MKTSTFIKLIALTIAVMMCAVTFTACALPGSSKAKYQEAYDKLEAGDYEAAYALFTELGDYKDAAKEAAYFRYIPTNHYVEYVSEEETDTITYTVTLNAQNLPATVVEEYGSGLKHTCAFTYNELGYVTRRECSDTEGTTTLYEATYDANGNLLHETRTDADGNVSEFDGTYNDQGQLLTVVTQNAPDYYDSYVCTYDAEGRESKGVYVYENETHVEEFTYDAQGKLLKKTWAIEGGEVYSIYDYQYDEKGRLHQILFTEDGEDGGYRKLTYNDKDQLITEHVFYTFGYEFTYNYEYDEQGSVIKMMYSHTELESGTYSDVTESSYKLVYLPFDYSEDEWQELCDSTQCWNSTHYY